MGHKHQGPVVRRPISTNPGLNFNLGFFFFCSKAFYRIIFSILFRASNHQIAGKKNTTEAPFTGPKIFGTARMKKVRVPKKLVRHG